MATLTKGRAVLFMWREGRTTTVDVFDEDDSHPDSPWHRAAALRDSCEDDFPNAIFAIGMNDQARDLMQAENMRRCGLKEGNDDDTEGSPQPDTES